jgi:hypothetical protein
MSTEKKFKLINLQREPLKPEKLRELSGLNLSDDQAKEVIWSLTKYARIVCDFAVQQEQSAECKNKSDSLDKQ